ncbi:EamA family transporter [Bacillaceae bacterium S4-13-56]
MGKLLIAMGAALWGMIGVFVTNLNNAGFTAFEIVAIRAITASIFLVTYTIFKNRESLKIKVRDSKYFIGTGIISIVFFNWCMFTAIEETSMSIAAILLYTAPIFVAIMARILFKELFTKRKVLALIMTFSGCAFVIGVLPSTSESISLFGVLVGVGSGFFYALYSIFGKYALVKYNSLTISVYTFIFAAIAVVPFSGLWIDVGRFASLEVWLSILGLGLFSTMLAYMLYTAGLNMVESSQASLIATIEPVVAAISSFLIFNERLDAWQYLGIILVISAVIFVQSNSKTKKPHPTRSAGCS